MPDKTPVRVHRLDAYLLGEVTELDGIPLTSVRKTILDLCGVRHPRAEAMLDFGLRNELAEIGYVWLYLEREWMRGRRGVRILRDLLIPRTQGYGPSDSDLEIMFRSIVAEAGLPSPLPQHAIQLPFGTIHVDFAYPSERLAIELDSYAWHLNRKAFDQDRERDNELILQGWNVLRFTWSMLRFDRARVGELIRQSLRVSA